MKRLFLIIAALLFSVSALAQTQQLCYTSNGSNCIQAIAASNSIKIDTAAATTAQIIAAVTSKNIFVTSFNVVAGGTGTFKFVYGTGTNCGTGTTDLTGAYPFKDQAVLNIGNGLGTILVVPPSNALCITTSATVQMSGSLSYAQY